MAIVKPFPCVRPDKKYAALVAALPYDVYNREEAKKIASANPWSFLNIDRPETQFPDGTDMYDDCVYEKAGETLKNWIANAIFAQDPQDAYYIYELTMNGQKQAGIVACSSIDDYLNGEIKKHENTREDKEIDRIRHVDKINAQTGPIFLSYRSNDVINQIVDLNTESEPVYDFTSEDGIRHRVWKIDHAASIRRIEEAFAGISAIYIADGHHRAASAVRVGLKRREEQPDYTGDEPFNYFLSVLFPDNQLTIMPYNRVVKDLNGMTGDMFLKKVEEAGFVAVDKGTQPVAPAKRGTFGLYLCGKWYALAAADSLLDSDPVRGLDVSILQDHLLGPVLGIGDPRVDGRIDFIGGIRGLAELERRCGEDMAAAFSMYPTSMEELFCAADAGLLMPPKSTWFEPKLRSGLFIHLLGGR